MRECQSIDVDEDLLAIKSSKGFGNAKKFATLHLNQKIKCICAYWEVPLNTSKEAV